MLLIPALGEAEAVDFCEFEVSMVYKVNFKPELHRETLSQTNEKVKG